MFFKLKIRITTTQLNELENMVVTSNWRKWHGIQSTECAVILVIFPLQNLPVFFYLYRRKYYSYRKKYDNFWWSNIYIVHTLSRAPTMNDLNIFSLLCYLQIMKSDTRRFVLTFITYCIREYICYHHKYRAVRPNNNIYYKIVIDNAESLALMQT